MTPRERLEAAGWVQVKDGWVPPQITGLRWQGCTFPEDEALAQLARDEAKETSDETNKVVGSPSIPRDDCDANDSHTTGDAAPVATSVSAPDEAELEKQWIADGSTNSFKTWLIRKVAELQGWKESQMACTPDYQEIGKLLDVQWGESVHDKIVPGICALRDSRDRLQEALRYAERELRWAGHEMPAKRARVALGDPPERGGRND